MEQWTAVYRRAACLPGRFEELRNRRDGTSEYRCNFFILGKSVAHARARFSFFTNIWLILLKGDERGGFSACCSVASLRGISF